MTQKNTDDQYNFEPDDGPELPAYQETNEQDPAAEPPAQPEPQPEPEPEHQPAAEDAPEPVAETVEEPQIDEFLVQRARGAGIDPDAFSSPEVLSSTLDALDRRVGAIMASQQHVQPVVNVNGQQPTPEELQQEKEAWSKAMKYELKWDEEAEELHPAIKQQFEGMNKFYADHVDKLHSTVFSLLQAQRQQEVESLRTRFDHYIGELPDEWGDTFGGGGISELRQNSPELDNRLQLLQAMDTITRGYQSAAQVNPSVGIPPEQEIFKQALYATFGDQQAQIHRKSINNAVQRRSAQMISRPTQRKGNEVQDPEAEARDFAKRFVAEKGLLDDVSSENF